MVKNLPCNAGDVGSIPGLGTKIAHAVERLSPRALEHTTARESCSPQREIPHDTVRLLSAATKTRCSQINRY